MKTIEESIQQYFANTLTSALLLEMVQTELLALEKVAPEIKNLTEAEKGQTITIDVIPSIPVSELGWSDVRTTDRGEQVSGPQRQALVDYLNNIKGANLQEKLNSLNKFYSEGLQFPDNASPATKISKILSYLVFYRTLTSIIQNFNAASAGRGLFLEDLSCTQYTACILGSWSSPQPDL